MDKKIFLIAILMFIYISKVHSEELENILKYFRTFKYAYFDTRNASVHSKRNMEILKSRKKIQQVLGRDVKFPCSLKNARSTVRPTTVHTLRAGDIDVVAGIGDSITAGVGLTATNAIDVALENRGMSASAGGSKTWKHYFTVPNMLKEFNPKLVGYASVASMTIHKESQFNMGETGALSEDTPYMTELLIKRIKSHPKVNITTDWKMITYMIGPNNFCTEVCFKNNQQEILNSHRQDLIKVLRIMKTDLPRTIVNIMPPPHLKLLTDMTGKSLVCQINNILECPCLFGPSKGSHSELFELMSKWQQVDIEITNMDEFDTDDFTVVLLPFSLNIKIPPKEDGSTDFSYLSEDCFHLSQKTNALVANSMWNNLFEPVGFKTTHLTEELYKEIKCPTKEHPYIFTRRNSNTF